MILRIDGNINRYYVQTLCMAFFPGSTFGENEVPIEGVPEVSVSVYNETSSNSVIAFVQIKLNDKISEATESVSREQETGIATHESLAVGRALFAAGKELLGHIPPWGILTGIRPAKIAGTLLAAGNGIMKTRRILRDEFFLDSKKAVLATSVASNEMKILKHIKGDLCSLYISIPFCPSRCSYCSFVSSTTPKLLALIDDYIDKLLVDLEETFTVISNLGLTLTTIYIGGGTPTTLSAEQLVKIFNKIKEHIDVSSLYEFTLEAGRPDTITKEKLDVAKEYGVTRVSVNPQTLSDDLLREIGRKHTAEQFYKAYELAKRSGIKDINVDLIAGLPGDDFKNFAATMDKIIDLAPSNITVHSFSVKKAADALRKNSNIYSTIGHDAEKCVSYAQIKAKFAGYKPYYMYRKKNTVGNLENVGFSMDGHEGLYNIFMMEETQTIFAVGAGAVTKLVKFNSNDGNDTRIERIFNAKYPYEYLKNDISTNKKSFAQKVIEFYEN